MEILAFFLESLMYTNYFPFDSIYLSVNNPEKIYVLSLEWRWLSCESVQKDSNNYSPGVCVNVFLGDMVVLMLGESQKSFAVFGFHTEVVSSAL